MPEAFPLPTCCSMAMWTRTASPRPVIGSWPTASRVTASPRCSVPPTLVVKVGGRALDAGIHAGTLVTGAAETTGGKGGGRPDLGRGKVGDPAKREAAVSLLRAAISETMGHAA